MVTVVNRPLTRLGSPLSPPFHREAAMSLLRPFLAFALLLSVGIGVEGAQAAKKKKDVTGPVRGVITMVKANETNDEGTISVRIPDKKDKDAAVNYIVNKETKIENGVGKTTAAAKFSDLKEDVHVIITPKEGAIGIAGKVQIVAATRKKE
jgi:hypothetical protein